VHRLPHLLGDLQERLDQPSRHGIRLVQQRRDQARHRLPKEWENQDKWNGGWVRKANGKIEPRQGGKWKLLMRIFANPNLPEIDDYYEPFTFDYDHLQSAPESKATPTARPRSLITGKRMEKIEWGPNWEEILGGEFSKRSKDKNFDDIQKEMYGQFENTFMMYLPRLCEHCLNPACVASCPSGAIYKREEDGIVLIDQDKCRGWRMCVSGCPYKKIYYNWKSGKAEKCIFCYPRIEAGQPTVCSETCVGRIRYLGVLLYDADRIAGGGQRRARPRPVPGAARRLPRSQRPEGDRAGAHRRHPDLWMEAARAQPGLQDGGGVEGGAAAAPRVPHAADGLVRAAAVADQRRRQRRPDRRQRRDSGRQAAAHPGQVPRQPADRRRHAAGGTRARTHAGHARLPARQACRWRINKAVLDQVGMSQAEVEEMYHVMAIANYEDRFVIPTTHREYAENTFDVRGGCGFSFGNGCSDGASETSLFGGDQAPHHPDQGGGLSHGHKLPNLSISLRVLAATAGLSRQPPARRSHRHARRAARRQRAH
jgi:nitrate reductase beta subunit